jgi:hypothetical protein
LRKNGAEKGDIGVVNAKVVCNRKASRIRANTRRYSTSDITEMAENNGLMDIDPEGIRVGGPYGKYIVNLGTIILLMCKNLMRCNPLSTAVCECKRRTGVKV